MTWHSCIDSAEKLVLELCGERGDRGDGMPPPRRADEGGAWMTARGADDEGDGTADGVGQASWPPALFMVGDGFGFGKGNGSSDGDGLGIGFGFMVNGDGWSKEE